MFKILIFISLFLQLRITYSQTNSITYENIFLKIPENLSIKKTQKILLKSELFYDIQPDNDGQGLNAKYKSNEYLVTTPDSIFFRRMPLIIKDTNNSVLKKDLITFIKLKYINSDTASAQLKTLHNYIMVNFPRITFIPITVNSKTIIGYDYNLDYDKEKFKLEIILDNAYENFILISGQKLYIKK